MKYLYFSKSEADIICLLVMLIIMNNDLRTGIYTSG